MTHTRILLTAAAAIAALTATPATVRADHACTTVDYQGAPAEICEPVAEDLTNCYWGWYQGSPIEICLPTGHSLPEGSTGYDGQPVVYHTSDRYTPPAVEQPAPVISETVAPLPVKAALFAQKLAR